MLGLRVLLILLQSSLFLAHETGFSNAKYTTLKFKDENCGLRNATYFNRIVGGHEASPGEFPWLVSLQLFILNDYRHICGGAVIDDEWILTAAHCVYGLNQSDLYIMIGLHDLINYTGFEKARRVDKIITSTFDFATFENDICLLKMNKPLTYNERISPICLPQVEEIFEGPATIAGWGRIGEHEKHISKVLRRITLPIMSKSVCDDRYKQIGFSRYLHKSQLCAGYLEGGKDACQGDSGGPLMCRKDDRYYICGIVSWGIGCARASFPGVYTKVSNFTQWIQQNTKK